MSIKSELIEQIKQKAVVHGKVILSSGFISAPNHIGRREVLRDRNGDPV